MKRRGHLKKKKKRGINIFIKFIPQVITLVHFFGGGVCATAHLLLLLF